MVLVPDAGVGDQPERRAGGAKFAHQTLRQVGGTNSAPAQASVFATAIVKMVPPNAANQSLSSEIGLDIALVVQTPWPKNSPPKLKPGLSDVARQHVGEAAGIALADDVRPNPRIEQHPQGLVRARLQRQAGPRPEAVRREGAWTDEFWSHRRKYRVPGEVVSQCHRLADRDRRRLGVDVVDRRAAQLGDDAGVPRRRRKCLALLG
jgi:hypothetical protein